MNSASFKARIPIRHTHYVFFPRHGNLLRKVEGSIPLTSQSRTQTDPHWQQRLVTSVNYKLLMSLPLLHYVQHQRGRSHPDGAAGMGTGKEVSRQKGRGELEGRI
jgi:hypothetical protein